MKPFKNQIKWILGLALSFGLVLPSMAQIQFASSVGSTNGAAMVPKLGGNLPLSGAAFYLANDFPQASSFAQHMPQSFVGGIYLQAAQPPPYQNFYSISSGDVSEIFAVTPIQFSMIGDPTEIPDVVMPEIPEPSSFALATGGLTVSMVAIALIRPRRPRFSSSLS